LPLNAARCYDLRRLAPALPTKGSTSPTSGLAVPPARKTAFRSPTRTEPVAKLATGAQSRGLALILLSDTEEAGSA